MGAIKASVAAPGRLGVQMSAPKQPSPQLRLTILLVVVACLFAALFARLWFLQVMNAPKAQAAAANNGIRLVYTQAPRGLIEDRNGNVLVGNVNEPVIEVSRLVASQNPAMVGASGAPARDDRPAAQEGHQQPAVQPLRAGAGHARCRRLSRSSTSRRIRACFRASRPPPCPSAPTAPWARPRPTSSATSARSANPVPEVEVEGYQPGDQIGLAGVEAEYESILRGTPGVQKLQVDSRGNVLTTLSTTQPVPGDDLRLTIDGNIQMIAETALEQGHGRGPAHLRPRRQHQA